MDARPLHLVVRFSDNLFSVGDVVAKHNNVCSQKGYVWFGKLGQTISQGRVDLLNTQIVRGIQTFVFLVTGNRRKSTFYRAVILAVANKIPESEKATIPQYYYEKGLIPYMKTWVKITKIDAIEISTISNLRAISSVLPLQETLTRSSSGYFLVCESENVY
jgi:hypothetical protein